MPFFCATGMLFHRSVLTEINTALPLRSSIDCVPGLQVARFFSSVCGGRCTPFDISQFTKEPIMTSLRFNRFARLASVVVAASTLAACNTPSRMGMPMGAAAGGSMATPDHMAKMDAQMKSMQAMHEKMMSAKTPAERNALMAEHMKSMQGGMAMMEGMGDRGDRGGMSGMQGAPTTPATPPTPGMGGAMMGGTGGGMGAPHQMMEKRMQMMQMMMKMMMDRMPPAPAK